MTTKGLRGVAAFLWARFARLYPLFLLMMLVYVALSSRTLALPGRKFRTIWQHPASASVLPPFHPHLGLYANRRKSGHRRDWRRLPDYLVISTEWFFYFAYPLVAWLILRARTPRLAAALALFWCALSDCSDDRPLTIGLAQSILRRSDITARLPERRSISRRLLCGGCCTFRHTCAWANSCSEHWWPNSISILNNDRSPIGKTWSARSYSLRQ